MIEKCSCHCEERSDEATSTALRVWIASLPRNDITRVYSQPPSVVRFSEKSLGPRFVGPATRPTLHGGYSRCSSGLIQRNARTFSIACLETRIDIVSFWTVLGMVSAQRIRGLIRLIERHHSLTKPFKTFLGRDVARGSGSCTWARFSPICRGSAAKSAARLRGRHVARAVTNVACRSD